MANRKTKTKDALVRNLGLGAIAAVVLGIILFPTIQDTFFANPSPTSSNSYEIDYNTGTIPLWIRGSLYRNGPGMYEVGDTKFNHFFDPMAMFQRFHVCKY